jgi:hypothetical protein
MIGVNVHFATRKSSEARFSKLGDFVLFLRPAIPYAWRSPKTRMAGRGRQGVNS